MSKSAYFDCQPAGYRTKQLTTIQLEIVTYSFNYLGRNLI